MKTSSYAPFALAWLALACGSGSSGAKDGGGGGSGGSHHQRKDSGPLFTATKACADYAKAWCTQLAACSSSAITIRYGSQGQCESSENAICVNTLAAPSTGDTPDDRESCAAALSSWACSDFLNNQSPPTACAPKTGKVASGGACSVSSQCSTGFCGVAEKSSCGTCQKKPVPGDSCAHLSNCGEGLVCQISTTTCVVPGTAGAMCGSTAPCGVGYWCVGAGTSTPGTCQAGVGTMGAACDPSLKTGPACDPTKSLTCNFMSKTCATLTFAAAGDPCGIVSGQGVDCQDGANCTSMPKMPGNCVAAVPDKTSCTPGVAPCATGERCIVTTGTTGTCEFDGATTCK